MDDNGKSYRDATCTIGCIIAVNVLNRLYECHFARTLDDVLTEVFNEMMEKVAEDVDADFIKGFVLDRLIENAKSKE